MNRWVTALIALMILPSDARAQEGLIPLGKLHETFSPSVNLSGSLIVGVRFGGALSGRLDVSRLGMMLPASGAHYVCLQMTTQDGRYYGDQSYDASGTGSGAHALDISSQYASSLSNYEAGDLAPLLVVQDKKCVDGVTGTIVVATLPGADTGKITIYVNNRSQSIGAFLVDQERKPLASTECAAITSGARTAFDHVCEILRPPSGWQSIDSVIVRSIGLTGNTQEQTRKINIGSI